MYKTTKAQAEQYAADLVATLGAGWRPVVWENLGWHHKAVSADGRVKVHESRYPPGAFSYTAFVGMDDSAGGRIAESGTSPHEALLKVYDTALAEQEEATKLVTYIKAALK